MENIAKSTSYGCYLDCDFETAKYPDDKTHIVGLLAEYVYDLEQRILHYDERYIKLWNEIETLRECVSKEFDQEQKIADLEAKLAECEKKAYSRGHSQRDIANEIKLNALREDVANKEKRIVELKQQLAENNKQIKTYAHEIAFLDKKIANIKNSCDYYMKRANDLVLKQNQKAIEQLEQIINLFEPYENEEKDTILCANNGISFLEYIDNQIKQLKENE